MAIKYNGYPEVRFHIDILDTVDDELITYWQNQLGVYLQAGIAALELIGDLLLRHGELKKSDAGNQDFVTVLLIHWVFQRLRNSLNLLLAGYFPDTVATLRQAYEGVARQMMNLDSADFAAKWLKGKEPKLAASAISSFAKGLALAELYHPSQKAVSAQIGLESDMEVALAGSKDRAVGNILFHNWLATLGIELFLLSNIYKELWLKVPAFASRTKNLERLAQEHDKFVRDSFPGQVSL